MKAFPKLLKEQDPDPVILTKKLGHVIFTGPHNGRSVPSCLNPCLGMDEEWFEKAHEAVDLHMDTLFHALEKKIDDISFISGNYSRLVCDLNALPDCSISENSSEHKHIKILQNQPDFCCSNQRTRRIEEIYWPYHDAKKRLINEKREEHGGVIVLDMHSFTPTWEGKKREVEIGTLRCEKTPYSRVFENFLREQSEYLFISGEPYQVENRPKNAAPLISQNNDLQYLGFEIRNDLIATDEGIEKMVSFLESCMDYLKKLPEQERIAHKRSQVQLPETDFIPLGTSWSV